MGAEPIQALRLCVLDLHLRSMAARLEARVFTSKMLRNMSFVLSLLKTNCSPITKPKPCYSRSGSPIPLQDISTWHERLFFFSLFHHTKTNVPTESCLKFSPGVVQHLSPCFFQTPGFLLSHYTAPLLKLLPLPRECAPAALSSLKLCICSFNVSLLLKEWQVSSHALGAPRRPDPASKKPAANRVPPQVLLSTVWMHAREGFYNSKGM
jgi:hypothetical protein